MSDHPAYPSLAQLRREQDANITAYYASERLRWLQSKAHLFRECLSIFAQHPDLVRIPIGYDMADLATIIDELIAVDPILYERDVFTRAMEIANDIA